MRFGGDACVFCFVTGAVCVAAIANYYHFFRSRITPRIHLSMTPASPDPPAATVTVVVVARDEEEHIVPCLASLGGLDYPPHLLQFVVVSDHSTDRTVEIMETFAARDGRFVVLRDPPISHGVSGKAAGMDLAARCATGDYVLFTDADCVVPPAWAKRMVAGFSPETGAVFGPVVFNRNHDKLYHELNSNEVMLFQNLSFGSLFRKGEYLGLMGANMGVRREALAAIGGFSRIGGGILEDARFGVQLLRETSWKLRGFVDEDGCVETTDVKGFGDFMSQRSRWLQGMNQIPAKKLLRFYMINGAAFSGLLVAGVFNRIGLVWAGVYVISKVVADALICARSIPLFKARKWYVVPLTTLLQMLFLLNTVYHAIWKPKILWKQRPLPL
jgi:cellulose synthase/poly-beta-1,6-N-acetylglucosamine synthase-like glycosyltransferase